MSKSNFVYSTCGTIRYFNEIGWPEDSRWVRMSYPYEPVSFPANTELQLPKLRQLMAGATQGLQYIAVVQPYIAVSLSLEKLIKPEHLANAGDIDSGFGEIVVIPNVPLDALLIDIWVAPQADDPIIVFGLS